MDMAAVDNPNLDKTKGFVSYNSCHPGPGPWKNGMNKGNGPNGLTYGSEIVTKTCMDLSYDIVRHMSQKNERKPPCKHTATLRRTVRELSEKHHILFKGIFNKIRFTPDNCESTFNNIAEEIFADGQFNWGRVVSVYAFGGYLAKHFAQKEELNEGLLDKITNFVGQYVARTLGRWISNQGGWDAFDDYFPEQNMENTIWKGLVFTAVGLGALMTMVAAR